jgi:hypothetical protein
MNTHKATIALIVFSSISLHLQGADDAFEKTCNNIMCHVRPNSITDLFRENYDAIEQTERSLRNTNQIVHALVCKSQKVPFSLYEDVTRQTDTLNILYGRRANLVTLWQNIMSSQQNAQPKDKN